LTEVMLPQHFWDLNPVWRVILIFPVNDTPFHAALAWWLWWLAFGGGL
jgi:hypothetical protein